MAGTKAGGLKAAATNKAKYGDDFYSNLGRLGGRNGHTGGFHANPMLAHLAGIKGGRNSKRGRSRTIKKVMVNGIEMTKIMVKKIHTNPQKVRVNYVN